MKRFGNWISIHGGATETEFEEAKRIARAQAEETLEMLGAADYMDCIKVWVQENQNDPLGYPIVCWKTCLPDHYGGADDEPT